MVTIALITGGVMSALLTALILISLAKAPRIWIQDMPKAMQSVVTPLTDEEKRQRLWWGVAFFAVALILPFGAAFRYEATRQPFTFVEAFAFLWLVAMVFNLVDLVLIDWLIVVRWHPSWTVMPQAEHLNHLNTYGYHFKAFLKGTVGIAVVALLGALIVALI